MGYPFDRLMLWGMLLIALGYGVCFRLLEDMGYLSDRLMLWGMLSI
jgi:hypothetical protein